MNLPKPVYTTYDELKFNEPKRTNHCFYCQHYIQNTNHQVMSKCKLYIFYQFPEGQKKYDLAMIARKYKCKGEKFESNERKFTLYDRIFR